MEDDTAQPAGLSTPPSSTSTAPRSRGGLKWILTLIGIAVLLAAGVGAYLVVTGSRDQGNKFTPKNEDAEEDTYVLPEPLVTESPAADLGSGNAWQPDVKGIALAVAAQSARLADVALQRAARRVEPQPETREAAAPLPRRNWEIQFFKGNTVENYARQLDFFGIELGVPVPGGKILYAFNLAKLKPDTRIGPVEAEKRCFLRWQRGDLLEAETTLLGQAGQEVGDRVVLKFLPPEIEAVLARIEETYAGDKADSIEKTRFGIRPKADGYDFYVMEQTYKQRPGVPR